jgi:hypothetical protein
VEIVINLVASAIYAILGAGSYRYLYLPYRRRKNALSRLSPLDFSKDPVYLCFGLVSPDESSKHYTVEQGDLSAITLGYQILTENYGEERVRIQNCMVTEPQLSEVSNLLTISGSQWNSVTERYMGRLGSPLRFADDRRAWVLCERDGSQKIFSNSYRPSGDPEVCYGIVFGGVVMRRGNKAQNVVICAGSNSFSTYGCVIALDDLRYSQSLRRMGLLAKLRNEPRWGIIVRVQNLSKAGAEPRGRLPFERGQLDVRVEQSLVAAEFLEPYVYE